MVRGIVHRLSSNASSLIDAHDSEKVICINLIRAHHSVGKVILHLKFTPKYRRGIFMDETVKRACEDSFL
jgi:hypothetical protein